MPAEVAQPERKWTPDATARLAARILHGPSDKTLPGLTDWAANEDLPKCYHTQVQFVQHLSRLIGAETPQHVLQASCAPLFERTPTYDSLSYLAWRLAANLAWLQAGVPVMPQHTIQAPEHAPLEIKHACYGWSRGKKPKSGTLLTYQVIDGPLCPRSFTRWHPNNYLPSMGRQLGIVTRKQPWSGNRAQLVGMRLVALVGPSKYDSSAVTFELWQPGQFRAFNKRLQARRATACPAGYKWACWRCPVGADRCPDAQPVSRACRPLTLALGWCPSCNKEVLHDGMHCTECRKVEPGRRTV